LQAQIFPPIPAAEMSDIPSFVYPPEKVPLAAITVEEIVSALSKAKPHKAPGPDGILFSFLSCLAGSLKSISQPCFKPA
jgi:hypothetical protein